MREIILQELREEYSQRQQRNRQEEEFRRMQAEAACPEIGQVMEERQSLILATLLGVLDGTATVKEALEEVKLRSRQYAKRQLTWLRRNEAIHWVFWEKERDFGRALQLSTEILTAEGVF